MDLVGHDFLTLLDFTPAEIGGLLELTPTRSARSTGSRRSATKRTASRCMA